MQKRSGIVTLKGRPLTLMGPELRVGDKAPEFEVLDNNLSTVTSSICDGKICIITTVPSLDTPVCDMETRRFNQEATGMAPDVKILTVSMDLPFAQKRWCGAAGVEHVETLSDHRNGSMGAAYGVLIEELRLLARAVFVIDKEKTVRYSDVMRDISNEPNYEEIIALIKKIS